MLTAKQERFVDGLVKGLSQREAYKAAYNAEKMKDETIDNKAYLLFKRDEVRARYNELMDEVADEAIATAVETLKEITDIAMGRKSFPGYDMFGNELERLPSMTARLKALEMLAKYHALFEEKVRLRQDGAFEVNIKVVE